MPICWNVVNEFKNVSLPVFTEIINDARKRSKEINATLITVSATPKHFGSMITIEESSQFEVIQRKFEAQPSAIADTLISYIKK